MRTKITHIKTLIIVILASMIYGQWEVISDLRDQIKVLTDIHNASSITNINRARRRA